MSHLTIKVLTVLFIVNTFVLCDIYLHNPRGSNNRLDESGRERDNENRMFDSQNNDRGGYNVGNLYYYTQSKLQIEWTNQHSCSSKNANCDIILQYMCEDSIRDGSDTRTIPEVNPQCEMNDCNSDFRFGMNENQNYYAECKRRNRNKGLFTADQRLGPTAISTRQNPNGKRYGYECSEERDYYPYWYPTPWIDIAILTNNPKNCEYYLNETENVKSRWYCKTPTSYTGLIPIYQDECEKIAENGEKAIWIESKPKINLKKPICEETQYTRDNHLGNTIGGNPPVFNWTLPSTPSQRCVLRVRYNISTNEYNSKNTFQNDLDNVNNELSKRMNLNQADANTRGFNFKNNPAVKLFSDIDFKLNLAINTAQYGRVFQDRSHVFEIRERPAELKTKKIINLNVRGKRGNIVQVYPAVEYDFVPNKLELSKNDYIHIQWTGSNKNPQNNDGQGLAGTDRSNVLLLKAQNLNNDKVFYSPLELNGQYGVNYPQYLLNSTFLNLKKDDLTKLAFLNQFGGSMDELDDSSTYFDLGPREITRGGVVYHYMSSRNNNFSNRDQKGEIIVFEFPFVEESIGLNGGTITGSNIVLKIPEGTFNQLTNIRIETKTKEQILNELKILNNNDGIDKLNQFDTSSFASDLIAVNFPKNPLNPILAQININKPPSLMSSVSVYRINSDYSLFTKIPLLANDCSDKMNIELTESGVYIARNESSYTVLIVILVLLGVIIIMGLISSIYLWRNPKYFDRIRYTACNVKRSMSDQI